LRNVPKKRIHAGRGSALRLNNKVGSVVFMENKKTLLAVRRAGVEKSLVGSVRLIPPAGLVDTACP